VFNYLVENCDHAGVWDENFDLMSFQLGFDVTLDDVMSSFRGNVIRLGDKLIFPSFIGFQYGSLNENVIAHRSVVKRLRDLGIYKTVLKHLKKCSRTQLDRDKDKDKDKEKDKENKNSSKLEFDAVYQKFPRKEGKKRGIEICVRDIKTPEQFDRLMRSVDNYAGYVEREKIEPRYIMHFKTFMGRWEEWFDPPVKAAGFEWDEFWRKVDAKEKLRGSTGKTEEDVGRGQVSAAEGRAPVGEAEDVL
jgi:hypothetical protein